MEQEQVKPMTPEEIAKEDAAAEQFYLEIQSLETDDEALERFDQLLKLHRRSPAAGFRAPAPKAAALRQEDVDKAAEELMG